eukprot:g9889.t1
MYIALSVDCFHTVSFMVKENSGNRRDRQIIIDTVVDFLCTASPILIMWFGFAVPISIQDLMQVALFPAFMMLTKLDAILEEIIRSRTAAATVKAQENTASQVSRRRKSLYRGLSHFEIAEQQQAAVPRAVHMGAAGCKCVFGLMFLSIAIVQLAVQHNTTCEPFLWENCAVKTPFCGNAFHPTCNCVVLNVRKHNWTALPVEIKEMTALKRVKISHGPLTSIFEDFGSSFKELTYVDFSYNELTAVPESVGNLKINRLILANNNLVDLPSSVWKNKDIFWLELDNNNVYKISPEIENAQYLTVLLISNNSLLTLPNELFVDKTKTNSKIRSLCLDGNNLVEIPKAIRFASALANFKVQNNYISNIPKEIGKLKKLHNIDLRNNTIKDLPEEILQLKDSLEFIYLHSNPICSNGWLDGEKDVNDMIKKAPGAGCKAQCSIYCQDRYKDFNFCGRDCNSKQCDYAFGACGQK